MMWWLIFLFQDIYINNLKNQSILYRANLNIKKAIKNHEDILNALNCFNSREVQKKERLCDEEKLNYSVLLMDTGEKKNFENAKIILDEIYKNENQKNFNLDNRRSVRINYYAYYLNR